MSAAAASGHSVAEQPATASDCQRDYQAAQAQRAESAGAQRDQLGSVTSGQQHTYRR